MLFSVSNKEVEAPTSETKEAKEVKEVKAPKETKAVKPAAKADNNTYPILNQELREAIKNPAIKDKDHSAPNSRPIDFEMKKKMVSNNFIIMPALLNLLELFSLIQNQKLN